MELAPTTALPVSSCRHNRRPWLPSMLKRMPTTQAHDTALLPQPQAALLTFEIDWPRVEALMLLVSNTNCFLSYCRNFLIYCFTLLQQLTMTATMTVLRMLATLSHLPRLPVTEVALDLVPRPLLPPLPPLLLLLIQVISLPVQFLLVGGHLARDTHTERVCPVEMSVRKRRLLVRFFLSFLQIFFINSLYLL